MNKLGFSRILMLSAILLIVVFQGYWISRLYQEEKKGLQQQANGIFRDVVYNLQVEKFKKDTMFFRQHTGDNLFAYTAVNVIRNKVDHLRKYSTVLKADSAKLPSSIVVIKEGHPLMDSIRNIMRHDTAKNQVLMVRRKQPGSEELPVPDTAMLRKMSQAAMSVAISYSASQKATEDSVRTGEHKKRPYVRITNVQISPRVKNDSTRKEARITLSPEKTFINMIADGRAIDDTIALAKVDSAYKKELTKAGIQVSFIVNKGKDDSAHRKDTASGDKLRTNIAKVGLISPYWYQASFDNPVGYLLKKISPQILFSVFLVVFTTIAFIFLFRNLAQQRRLSEIKNDFISNITHELKTPIATVNVAIEALQNFGGLQDPARTKEYLDISVSELKRLGLLVDKVLKFAIFENQEIELQKEPFDLLLLIEEVISSMKLQFEKKSAQVSLESEGDNFMFDADKVHIASVVYNLLDNALKYSNQDPRIGIRVLRKDKYFELRVSDNGVGIPDEYKRKIFEQFFRVPNGDRHNIKGYGLGLSYVNHIVMQHGGFIEVESEPGKGSTFIVRFIFVAKGVVDFGDGRKILKKYI